MKVHYYRTEEDMAKHLETEEPILWLDGFATDYKQDIRFCRPSKEEVYIPFRQFISVTN